MKIILIACFCAAAVLGAGSVFAHGRSEQMNQMLNAKAPDWLSVGRQIVAEHAKEVPGDEVLFRPLPGGSKSTRNRVTIPSRGIEIRVEYPISHYFGSSLSPDGTKLIINSGTTSRLYEVSPQGEFVEKDLQVPNVTYDDGPKGFITGWSWVDDDTLVGRSEISDESNHAVLEQRLYLFHREERVLNRLDLSALGLSGASGFTLAGIGSDLNHFKIVTPNGEIAVKADLTAAPKLEQREGGEGSGLARSISTIPSPPLSPNSTAVPSSVSRSPGAFWAGVIVAVVAVALVGLMLKSRKQR